MKKILLTLAVAVAFTIGISSCNNNNVEQTECNATEQVDTVNQECEHHCHHQCTCPDTACAAAHCQGCPDTTCCKPECCKAEGKECCKAEGKECCKAEGKECCKAEGKECCKKEACK